MQQPLYKYLPKRYLDAFIKRGTLKVGTLYEYRNTEVYGPVIGDANEGLHKTELSLPGGGQIDLDSGSPEADLFKKHVLRDNQPHDGCKIILKDGARLIAQSNSEDLYIYCMTSKYSPAVMREFGCDACLEIFRPAEFLEAITRKIRHRAAFAGLGPIEYRDRNTDYTEPHTLHPAVMKDSEFQYQQEWRAIFAPNKIPRHPIVINVPRAISYCRPYTP